MPTPFESAQLNLQLFDLRREPVLREARAWFSEQFNPESFEEFVAIAGGERNASFRMVVGYWDMAASLVTQGAIDREAFLAAHSEIIGMYAKLSPYLAQLRALTRITDYGRHIEQLVQAIPDVDTVLETRRAQFRAAAQRRAAAHAATIATSAS